LIGDQFDLIGDQFGGYALPCGYFTAKQTCRLAIW